MNIFEDIPPGQGRETLADAMATITDRLSGIEPPRSLCELHLDAEDYQWLCDWALAVEPRTIDGLARDTSSFVILKRAPIFIPGFIDSWKNALGCMFLLLSSEIGAARSAGK